MCQMLLDRDGGQRVRPAYLHLFFWPRASACIWTVVHNEERGINLPTVLNSCLILSAAANTYILAQPQHVHAVLTGFRPEVIA